MRALFFGIFEDPNDLAQFLATCIPFAFAMFKRMNFFKFCVACLIGAVLIRGVINTDSRGGQIALAATLVLMFATLVPARKQPLMLALLVLGGLIACPLANPFMDGSARSRIMFWGDANQAFKHNMIFGVGYGVLQEYISDSKAVHNAFVECYASIGAFGYWFWFGIVYAGIRGAWQTLLVVRRPQTVEDRWLKRYATMSIAAFGGFLSSSYFLTRSFVFPLFFLMAIMAVLPLVAERVQERDVGSVLDINPQKFLLTNTFLSLTSIMYIYFTILIFNRM